MIEPLFLAQCWLQALVTGQANVVRGNAGTAKIRGWSTNSYVLKKPVKGEDVS